MDSGTTQSLPKSTSVLDVVLYLASLASNPRDIDPILNTVRTVTAHTNTEEPTSANDVQKLEQVREQLETYLVTQERVRAFTPDNLRQRVQDRFRFGSYFAKRAKKLLVGLLLATPLLALALIIPQPEGLPASIADAFVPLVAISLLITWLCVIAALQFWLGLGGFQQRVKQAYAAICVGTIFVGLGVLQLPVIVSLGWLDTPFFKTGGFMSLHIISVTVLFLGICLFARALGAKNIGRMAAIMLLTTAVVAITGGLLAGAINASDITPVGRLWVAVLCAMSASIVLHIKRTSTPVYGRAMGWFAAALLLGAATHSLGLFLWLTGQATSPIILLPYFVMAPLYVAAGYAFNKIREY